MQFALHKRVEAIPISQKGRSDKLLEAEKIELIILYY